VNQFADEPCFLPQACSKGFDGLDCHNDQHAESHIEDAVHFLSLDLAAGPDQIK
jgi:hypothetical protein